MNNLPKVSILDITFDDLRLNDDTSEIFNITTENHEKLKNLREARFMETIIYGESHVKYEFNKEKNRLEITHTPITEAKK